MLLYSKTYSIKGFIVLDTPSTMTEPATLTVGAIAALAFVKFLESSASEVGKRLTPTVLGKIDVLRKKIVARLRGISEVDELNATIDKGQRLTERQINLLTPHLEAAMKEDAAFAQDIQQLSNEINQEITVNEILGRNIQNIYGGAPVQINDPEAPIFTGPISGGTFNFTTNNY